MNMEALMNEALERINRQYGIRLMLEKARPGCVFPKVDVMGCFVRFNPKIRSFLTLYNLMLQFPSIDSESVVFFPTLQPLFGLRCLSQSGGCVRPIGKGGESNHTQD